LRIIELDKVINKEKTIMIFVEGTILKPKSWLYLYSHSAYIPIDKAPKLLKTWEAQGVNIIYCTSRKRKQADNIAKILKQHSFPGSWLVSRDNGEKYKDIVEQLKPDILIEDDCKSIGGSWQMCITKVQAEIKENMKSIIVPEFKGISHLPSDIKELVNVKSN